MREVDMPTTSSSSSSSYTPHRLGTSAPGGGVIPVHGLTASGHVPGTGLTAAQYASVTALADHQARREVARQASDDRLRRG